jgi:hypothetical protein
VRIIAAEVQVTQAIPARFGHATVVDPFAINR